MECSGPVAVYELGELSSVVHEKSRDGPISLIRNALPLPSIPPMANDYVIPDKISISGPSLPTHARGPRSPTGPHRYAILPVRSSDLHPAPQFHCPPSLRHHQRPPHHTFHLHPPRNNMRRLVRSMRRPLHTKESQPSPSGIGIGQLECVPE
jgi:hypothetical protein